MEQRARKIERKKEKEREKEGNKAKIYILFGKGEKGWKVPGLTKRIN